nr:MAG TPA: hypothetical protein [Caudoviricetes sp.]
MNGRQKSIAGIVFGRRGVRHNIVKRNRHIFPITGPE